jgi:hypothetical protein
MTDPRKDNLQLTDAQKKEQEFREKERNRFIQEEYIKKMGGWIWTRELSLPTDRTLHDNDEEEAKIQKKSLATLNGTFDLGDLKPGIYKHPHKPTQIRVNDDRGLSIEPHTPPELRSGVFKLSRDEDYREAYGSVMDFLIARKGCKSFTISFNGAQPEWIADKLKDKILLLLDEAKLRGATVKLGNDVVKALGIMENSHPKTAKKIRERLIELEKNQRENSNLYAEEKIISFNWLEKNLNEKVTVAKQAASALSTVLAVDPPIKDDIQKTREAFEKANQEVGQVIVDMKKEMEGLRAIGDSLPAENENLINRYMEQVKTTQQSLVDITYKEIKAKVDGLDKDKSDYSDIKASFEKDTGSVAKAMSNVEQALIDIVNIAEEKPSITARRSA